MEKQKSRVGITDILLLAIGIVFLIGIKTFFKPCGPKDDGSWMSCHWAGNAVAAMAAVLVVIAVIHLIVADSKIKMGLACAMLPVAVVAALIPGHVIGLCMMDTMRCHAVMTPATILLAVVIAVVAVADIIIYRRK